MTTLSKIMCQLSLVCHLFSHYDQVRGVMMTVRGVGRVYIVVVVLHYFFFMRLDCVEQVLRCSKTPVYARKSSVYNMPPVNDDELSCFRRSQNLMNTSFSNGKHKKEFSLTILFTSDLHGHLRQIPKLAALKEQLRASGKSVLLIDMGDISFGSIFDRYYGYKGSYEIMQLAGYDALALGTHDYLEDRHTSPFTSVNYSYSPPILSINPPDKFARYVLPSTTINTSGVMVGLIGYMSLSVLKNNTRADYIVTKIASEAYCLRKFKFADVVILLVHEGLHTDFYLSDVADLQGHVDLVLGGHSQMELCDNAWHVRATPFIAHTGHNAKRYGSITLAGRKIPALSGQSQIRNSSNPAFGEIALHSSLNDMTTLQPASHMKVSELLLKRRHGIVTKSKASSKTLYDFNDGNISWDGGRNCRHEPCFTGKIITTMILKHFKCDGYVLLESGSIRENFHSVVTEDSLKHTLPWNNSMIKMRVPSRVLAAILEHSVQAKGSGEFLQIGFWNLSSTAHCSSLARLSEEVITSTEIVLESVLSRTEVEVIVSDWLARGGDTFSVEGVEVLRSELITRDIVRNSFIELYNMRHREKVDDNQNENDTNSIAIIFHRNSKLFLIFYEGIIALISECIAIVATVSFQSPKDHSWGCNEYFSCVIFAVRVISSAIYWPLYYHALRVYNIVYEVGSLSIKAQRGFFASLISASIVSVVTNPCWVFVSDIEHHETINLTNWLSYAKNCHGLQYKLLLVLIPSIKMFFFEGLIAYLDYVLGNSGIFIRAFVNGLCGCAASLISTIATYPFLTMQSMHERSLYDTLSRKRGLLDQLLMYGIYDFVSFFFYKVFFTVANMSPYYD